MHKLKLKYAQAQAKLKPKLKLISSFTLGLVIKKNQMSLPFRIQIPFTLQTSMYFIFFLKKI